MTGNAAKPNDNPAWLTTMRMTTITDKPTAGAIRQERSEPKLGLKNATTVRPKKDQKRNKDAISSSEVIYRIKASHISVSLNQP